MKYLKTFEANSHWKDEIFDKVKFERKQDIEEIFYDLMDIGMSVSLKEDLKNGFKSARQRHEYLKSDMNLYKTYEVNIYDNEFYDSENIDRVLEIKQLEIESIERLKSLGFNIDYSNRGKSIRVELYHTDDIVDKSLFIKDIVNKVGINDAFDRLKSTFSKIADISKTTSGDITVLLNNDGREKYTLGDLHDFVSKVLKNYLNIAKVKIFKSDTEPSGILVSEKEIVDE